ncbi:hypothetical protein D6C77_09483 [Aureobasidium pullulans]|nr:hypothetical protein D6C77_09483 [Aureobasidium pullulans]
MTIFFFRLREKTCPLMLSAPFSFRFLNEYSFGWYEMHHNALMVWRFFFILCWVLSRTVCRLGFFFSVNTGYWR